MTEEIIRKPVPRPAAQTTRFRIGALLVLALAVGLILWLALRDKGSNSSSAASATAVSAEQIKTLAASVGHPIFWAGAKDGYTYELTRQSSGTIIIRYLPPGARVGDSKPYLSVATYPFRGAFGAIQSVRGKNIVSLAVPRHGVAEYSTKYPASVHLAYPGIDYQVEVYDPTPGNARAIATSGELVAVGQQTAAAKPRAVTFAQLKRVSRSVGHPIYWVGPRRGYTYELTRQSNGTVYIRYLPPRAKVGSPQPYLSVATYAYPGAFDATRALGTQRNETTFKLAGGGVAVVNKSYPQSIHLAYPKANEQVEVYDPSAGIVRFLVSSGQVRAVR